MRNWVYTTDEQQKPRTRLEGFLSTTAYWLGVITAFSGLATLAMFFGGMPLAASAFGMTFVVAGILTAAFVLALIWVEAGMLKKEFDSKEHQTKLVKEGGVYVVSRNDQPNQQ